MIKIDDQTLICFALKEYGQVGPKLFLQLSMMYGQPGNIYDYSSDEIASMNNISLERAEKIVASQDAIEQARETIENLQTMNIAVISYFDESYPERLRRIPDPPIALYVRGDLSLPSEGGVAIVGTSAANQDGIRASVDFARALSEQGQTIISGLALGIDTAAHLGALKNSGKTIAVLGCGHLSIYPEENESLAGLIAEQGTLVSEYDIHAKAIPGRLVSRNRLIAGLADAVLIMQIGDKRRGELYAAEAAIDQGKSVFIFDPDDRYDVEILHNNLVIKINSLEQIDQIMRFII